MTNEEEFTVLKEMFNSEGWKLFQKYIEDTIDGMSKQSVTDCPTNDQWQHRRGEISQLQRISGYQYYIEFLENQLENEEEEEDAYL